MKALVQAIWDLISKLRSIERKMDKIMANLDALNAAVAAIQEDVTTVKQVVTNLKQVIVDLQAAVEQGKVDQAAIDAATATLTQADTDLDSVTTGSSE